MFSENLLHEMNEQIKFELFSSQLYLATAAYCSSVDLDGFANFFMVQAEEERFHGMKFYNFVNEMDATPVIHGLDTPRNDFSSLSELFEFVYKHEKFVTERIYLLMDIATEEKEHATISFLKWFVDEQVEEMATFKTMLQKVKLAEQAPAVLYTLDSELASRVFTPPTK